MKSSSNKTSESPKLYSKKPDTMKPVSAASADTERWSRRTKVFRSLLKFVVLVLVLRPRLLAFRYEDAAADDEDDSVAAISRYVH